MMDIYEPESDGGIDLSKARLELKRTDGMRPERQRFAIAEIAAAAQLDIAASLRIIAAEAARAMMHEDYLDGVGDTLETPEDPEGGDLIVEGDLVAVDGHAEPGEVKSFRFTEGELFAAVDFADGSQAIVAASALTRLFGDERDDEVLEDAADPANDHKVAESVEILDPVIVAEGIAEDIDDDFDGDAPDAEAESALEILKANEAARKAAKKSTAKKGKKS